MGGVLEEWAASPYPLQLRRVVERSKLHSGVQGGAPADKRFSRVLSVHSGLSRQFSGVYCSL